MEIPPLVSSVAGSVTRWALTGLAAYLVNKGVISEADAGSIILGVGAGLASLAWSIWQKWTAHAEVSRLRGGDPNGV